MRLLVTLLAVLASTSALADSKLLNASYDSTQELYAEYDANFDAFWSARFGIKLSCQTMHAPSAAQAQAVIGGLDADVATLAMQPDIDAIVAKGHLIGQNWQRRLPHHASPYLSTVLFVVRKGNPKGIHDWSDLVRDGVQVVTANPKTSGGARWGYLAAWGAAERAGKDPRAFATELYKRAAIVDGGARDATTAFARGDQGDALLTSEDEANAAVSTLGADKLEIVVPSVSIQIEPVVAVVDGNVDKHGVRAIAEAYLKYLFTPAGQEIVARHHYRPIDPGTAAKYAKDFPSVPMFTVDQQFGGWPKAEATHFADGGMLDQILHPTK